MTRRACSLLATLFLTISLGWAQSQPPATAIPKNPKDLMLLASRVNGLSGIDKPWHLKANYQTFDADGQPKDQGIFEEWWASPTKYKISYTSKAFNQVEYRNGDKDSITGDSEAVPPREGMLMTLPVSPLPTPREIGARKYIDKNQKVGSVELRCISSDSQQDYTTASTYCMAEQSGSWPYKGC